MSVPQALVDALKLPDLDPDLEVVDIGPLIEYAVRTGPVSLGGNGEDPKKVAEELGLHKEK